METRTAPETDNAEHMDASDGVRGMQQCNNLKKRKKRIATTTTALETVKVETLDASERGRRGGLQRGGKVHGNTPCT
jgi:hypothetical protein